MHSFLTVTASSLLLSACLCGAVQAEQSPNARPSADELTSASVTSNLPPRAGEASTMTNGVPNLLTSNVQVGELGIQTRLTVRKHATALATSPSLPATSPDLRVMGAARAASQD